MADGSGNGDAGEDAEERTALPRLTSTAATYPGCCLALSSPLLAYIDSLLPPSPVLTLSIGSGFGLLEALLTTAPYSSHIVGVEVEPSPNKYLPAARHRLVHGTRFLDSLAAAASVWLFVYPRRVRLVSEYITAYGSQAVQTIVWVGPRADWDDYRPCFASGWHLHTQGADRVGAKSWDLIAIARRVPA